MDTQTLPTGSVWPGIAALFLAVFVPLMIWCIYAYRIRQITTRSLAALVAVELAALVAIAILARY